jgi:hypothetical protein
VSSPIWGSWPDIINNYSLTVTVLFCGAPSLTSGRGLSFVYDAGLASAVSPGSEPLRSRDHILLSQIWDFLFRRLLRLSGSRWSYSIPPPHGDAILLCMNWTRSVEWYRLGADCIENTASSSTSIVARGPLRSNGSSAIAYLRSCCLGIAFVSLFVSRSLSSNESTCHSIYKVCYFKIKYILPAMLLKDW